MSSGLSVSATIVDGVFVWQQAGEPQRLPLLEQSTSSATAEWSTPVLSFIGRAVIGLAVLAGVGLFISDLGEHKAPTTMAGAPDPITTGSIKPLLRPTIGTDEEERTKALARASAMSSRQDEVGRRAVNMMCSECGLSTRTEPGATLARPSR